VIAVDQKTAHVRLLLDSRSAVAVTIERGEGVPAVVKGEHGLALRITLIPNDAPIEPGDRVLTSGIEPGIPRGLVIGTVQDVAIPEGELFQAGRVIPAIAFDQLTVLGFLIT
jgi:rod shape-determining protein MreC